MERASVRFAMVEANPEPYSLPIALPVTQRAVASAIVARDLDTRDELNPIISVMGLTESHAASGGPSTLQPQPLNVA
jgi:hypothetical protein